MLHNIFWVLNYTTELNAESPTLNSTISVTTQGCPKGLKDGLRHTNFFLSKSVNILLLLLLVATEDQIMKHLLGSGTNQPVERINIMSPLRFSLHMPRLGRNCIRQDGACISELWYFCSPPHPIARISDWFCNLYTTSKRCHWYRSCTSHPSINLSWTANIPRLHISTNDRHNCITTTTSARDID